MSLFLTLSCGVFVGCVVCFVILAYLVAKAPEGYQDDTGYHNR